MVKLNTTGDKMFADNVDESKLSRDESKYLEALDYNKHYLNEVTQVIGLSFEEYEQSDHVNLDKLEEISEKLESIFNYDNPFFPLEITAMEVYKLILDNPNELVDKPPNEQSLLIKNLFEIENYPNLSLLEQIEKYYENKRRNRR